MDTKEMLRRTKQFGYNCIDLSEYLEGSYLKNHVRSQLIRCATSVGANYRAARLAQTKASFVAKISISIEEADESAMWLELIFDKKLLDPGRIKELKPLLKEANELTAIFVSSLKTVNNKINNSK